MTGPRDADEDPLDLPQPPPRPLCALARSRCLVVWLVLLGLPLASAGWAQGGPLPPQVDFLTDLWAKVQQAGPFAAMICLYFMIRAERRAEKMFVERDGLLERVITAINLSSATVQAQNQIIERQTSALNALTTISGASRKET